MKTVRSYQARNQLCCRIATSMRSKNTGSILRLISKDTVKYDGVGISIKLERFTNSDGWIME